VTVGAMALLGQCNGLKGVGGTLASLAVASFFAAAACLYLGRNDIGRALDLAGGDPPAAGKTAARGLAWFHCGMAVLFAGCGFAAAFRLGLPLGGVAWLAPAVAGAMCLAALGRAFSWLQEARNR